MIAIEALTSALSYVALALLLGQLVVAGFVLPKGEPHELRRSSLTFARSSLVIFLCSSTLALLIQGAKLQRGFPSAELLWRYVTAAQSGKVWLARELYAVALTIGIWFVIRQEAGIHSARLLTLLALPLVASRSLTSHAVAVRENTVIVVSSDTLHLIATALWAGGLIALWRALRLTTGESSQPRAWIVALVNRFSRLALVSVALLGTTGLYQSWIHVGSFTTLVNTDYGKVLLLKSLLFSLMLSFGALNFFSTRKLLARAVGSSENDQQESSRKALRRIGIESLVGLMIFGASGLLTVLPPAVHAVHRNAATAPVAQTELTIVKKYLPAQGASVKILAPNNGALVSADRMTLKFTLHPGKLGHHVHAYVDGELMGMFQSKTGTLNGLKPGRHRLELRVVAEDHQTELDAFDQVEFTVN